METSKMNSCILNSRSYPTGGQVCDDRKCLECRDGYWQERFIDRIFGAGP